MWHRVLLLALLTAPAQAAVFKCVTASGEVSFRDTPCDSSGVRVPVQSLPEPGAGLRDSERRWLREREQHKPAYSQPHKRSGRKAAQVQERRCWRKQQLLDQVRAKLRRGYKPVQGERLRRQRRQYEDYLFRYCD